MAKAAKIEERTHGKGQRQERQQEAGERWQGRRPNFLDVWKIRTRCSLVPTRRQQDFVCHCVEVREHAEEANDSEEDLQAWCLLEESDNDQWPKVVSKRGKQK